MLLTRLSNARVASRRRQETQRKWAYLETLFIGSDEVKKELPEDAEPDGDFESPDVEAWLAGVKAGPRKSLRCVTTGDLPQIDIMQAT